MQMHSLRMGTAAKVATISSPMNSPAAPTIATRLWRMTFVPSQQHRSCAPICMSLPLRLKPLVESHDSVLTPLPPTHSVNGSTVRREQLYEKALCELNEASDDPTAALMTIDTIQRLGIGYHFEEDISVLLQRFSEGRDGDDLFLTSLRFRLLRQHGRQASQDVFHKFVDKNGQFKETLNKDVWGTLSLYEASSLRAEHEEILSQALRFSKAALSQSMPSMDQQARRCIAGALETPRHLRTPRLEARHYIDEYGKDSRRNPTLLGMAKLDFNMVQLLHRSELAEVSRWWKELGLVEKLSFARDRPMECYLWTVGIFPEPYNSHCRIELTKVIAILLVIDDIFDSYGSLDELILFNDAIKRWDLGAMEQLPEYMKICYTALYNTTGSVADKVFQEHGLGMDITQHLKQTWMDLFEAFLAEAKWFKSGYVATMDEYLENGVTTGGTYMALVHTFFLLGKLVTQETVALLMDPYPQLFSCSGKILRLWDDLGTAREEEERGDVASSMECYRRENDISSESEGREAIRKLINTVWIQLNAQLIAPNGLPLSTVNASLNLSRTSQLIYQHGDDNSVPTVEDHAHALFFKPTAC